MTKFNALVLAVLSLIFTANTGEGAVVTYTDLTTWQGATTQTSIETFGGATLGDLSTGGIFGSVAYDGFSLSGNGNGERVAITTSGIGNSGQDTPIPASFGGQNYLAWGNISGNDGPTLTFTFDTPTYGFGFNWFNTDVTDQDQLSILPNLAGPFSSPPFTVGGNTGFFGVTSDTPLTSFTISTQFFGGYVSDRGIDNVRLASAAATPEPATLAVFGGIALAGAFGYRRRKAITPTVAT